MAEKRIAIVALRPLTYHGQAVAVGEQLHVKPIEAAAFIYQKTARYPHKTADPAASEARRKYKRRDLVAE